LFREAGLLGCIYSLSVPVRLDIRAGLGLALEHGPSRNHAKSPTSESPDLRIGRGHIVTQIVRHSAFRSDMRNTWIGSCFVSPSQYGLALYQRWMTFDSTSARKILGAASTHWAVPTPWSNWLAISIRSSVTAGSVRVKHKIRGSLILPCADTVIDSRSARTGRIPWSVLVVLPLAWRVPLIAAITPTTIAIVPIVPKSSSSTRTGSMLTSIIAINFPFVLPGKWTRNGVKKRLIESYRSGQKSKVVWFRTLEASLASLQGFLYLQS
jgi:hypothetical protein